ncbi:general transcription factor 3C polypeptide 1-like isoform X3 [Myxocyprinus asiaticus]|uniref:general transcription factor 3C polypeptide 1-like isoform X3 n=1 Tax=Myxocyprinus asiaticus TaxID=70543 RepID=UPI0022218AF4|nr:general transcription factor 3C polypeptide 1-like isoform X3 [Myxocyprinus asiaticus]
MSARFCLMMMMDPLEAVLDEVALEGLDGISVQTLWLRLQTRQPVFGMNLDPLSKQFIWSAVSRTPEIRFYLLPEPRKPVTIHDRFVEVDHNTGIHEMLEADPDDVYPLSVVTDDPDGIQGSCLYYKERTDITDRIRTAELKALVTLEQAQTRWGEKLVMVASQDVRYRTLIGPEGNSELKLPDMCYCILERLGRARWQGELQRDLHIHVFRTDAGKMHYLRRALDRNRMITLQPHVMRLPKGGQQHSLLLLLKRFHVDRRGKYDILMEATSQILSELPNKIGIMIKIRGQLRVSERTFKRVYQYMTAAKMVSVLSVPLQELDPDGRPFKTQRGTDVYVRCLKLLKPYGQKEVEEDEEDENNDEDGDAIVKGSDLVVPRDIERDMITQAYDIVVSTGTRGISQSALRVRLNIGKLEGRMICRLLQRINMIKGFMVDEGRQRTTKYISKHFVEQSQLNVKFTKEQERSKHLRTTYLTEPDPEPQNQSELDPEPIQPMEVSEEVLEGSSEGQEAQTRLQIPLQTKQSKLVFKKKPSSSPRVGGAKSSQKAKARQKTDDSCPIPADHAPSTSASQSHVEDAPPVIEEVFTEEMKKAEVHETYRLLKRKNMIIEAVRCSKVIEGFYSLQKLLTEEERKDGVNSKVCKKSVVRLTRMLSREGLLKLYRTIVIQDGVHRKVEFVVHPSVTPDDPLVKSTIEQIRLRISSSASAARIEPQTVKTKKSSKEAKEKKASTSSRLSHSGAPKKMEEKMGFKSLKTFRPVLVPGLGRSFGFQPKMPRLRIVHAFLWYLIYGHPLRKSTPADPDPDPQKQSDPKTASPSITDGQTEEGTSVTDTERFKVYVNACNWKRFIPPMPVHKDFGYGWALVSDVLISMPLSVLMQVVQINYKVEGLEHYLNDPIKQHYLIRFLPPEMKRQLLHKRKYIFSFHENLQRLCFMGLLQFGPYEKFMDKDQVFVFLKTKATILDTTVCDPHYNMAIENIRPFERRHYVFNSSQNVDNYWFDLLCVCLNTPLGVARTRPNVGKGEAEGAESDVAMGTECSVKLQYMLQGSSVVVDDGVTPGDGQGAGGLDSSFFGHLKRNWSWTSHLVNTHTQNADSKGSHTVRLRNLLSKHPPPKLATHDAVQTGVKVLPPAVLEEDVTVTTEPSSRNEEVRGGRKLQRNQPKKEISKPAHKKVKGPSVRKRPSQMQDETDRKALLQMTKQRVTWTHLEDSLLMLCRVTSHFLNRKLKKPFVPWTVVRDVLHAEFEFSLDKTSLAVGRRTRYIMKNPQAYLNYRICLAEMYQDKELIDKFMKRNNDYNDPQVCAAEYKEFVSALRSKFSSSSSPSDVILPDTKEELFNKFKLYAVGDVTLERTTDVLRSPKDIHVLVLFNLIQSTLVLTNAQMKNYSAFPTFCMYTRYQEQVLSEAFQVCRKRGLVNRRRPTTIYGLKKCHALPFLPMSFQLSQHYYRFFTWRVPSTVCNEVFDLMMGLYQAGGSDRPDSFSFQKDPENDRDKDQRQEEQEVERTPEEEQTEKQKEMVVKEDADTQGMLQFPMDAPGGACACCLSLMTLGLLSVDVSIPQQIVIIDSSVIDHDMLKSLTKALEEEDEDEEERKRKPEVKPNQVSHTNYLLMRGFYAPGILRSHTQTHNSNCTDNIMINACTFHMQLRQTPKNTLFTQDADVVSALTPSSPPTLPAWFMRVYPSTAVDLQPFLDRCVSVLGYGPLDVQAVQEIRDAVEQEAEFGIDRQDLCQRFVHLELPENGRNRSLQQYIQDLVDGEQLVEVGAQSQRLVSLNAASHWLLQSVGNGEQTQQVSLKRGPAYNPSHATPPPKKRRVMESDLKTVAMDTVSTDAAVKHTVAMDTVSTDAAVKHTVAMDTVSTDAAVKQTVAMDTVSTDAAVTQTVAMDIVSTDAAVTQTIAMDTVSTDAGVNQTVAIDTVSTDAGVNQTVAIDTVSTEAGVNQTIAMDTVSTETAVSQTDAEQTVVMEKAVLKDAIDSEQHTSDDKGVRLCNDSAPSQSKDGDGAVDQEKDEMVRFVSRPWRVVDGSLNGPVCKGMLESLLLHIMMSPAICESVLLQHYIEVLQPVVVLDLLQVLIELGCVRKRYIVQQHKTSLFSKPKVPQIKGQSEISVRDAVTAFYEPTVDCMLRLARVFPHELNWNKWVQLGLRV